MKILTFDASKKIKRQPKKVKSARCNVCGLVYPTCERLHCNGIPCEHGMYYGFCGRCRTLTPFLLRQELKMLRDSGSTIQPPKKLRVRKR